VEAMDYLRPPLTSGVCSQRPYDYSVAGALGGGEDFIIVRSVTRSKTKINKNKNNRWQ